MRVNVLNINDPDWPDVLRELHHDFYHRPDYVGLDAARMDARPEAFLAEEGDRRFFVTYLLRSCDGPAGASPGTSGPMKKLPS